jgi:hypothetical protein
MPFTVPILVPKVRGTAWGEPGAISTEREARSYMTSKYRSGRMAWMNTVCMCSAMRPRITLISCTPALENYVVTIEGEASVLLDQIPAPTGVVDVNSLFQIFSLNLMSKLTFSFNAPLEGREGTQRALKLLDQSQTLLSTFGHVPWIYAIAKYIPGLLKSNSQFSKLANRLVERRRKIDPDIPDLFFYLLKTEHNPHAAGFPLMWEARLAIVVGRSVEPEHIPLNFPRRSQSKS